MLPGHQRSFKCLQVAVRVSSVLAEGMGIEAENVIAVVEGIEKERDLVVAENVFPLGHASAYLPRSSVQRNAA
jgi:hypothetical protein